MKHTNILGVKVSAINMTIAVNTLSKWIDQKEPNYVCVTPVHSVMLCHDDIALKQIYNNAGMVTPDGMPIVWLSRWFGASNVSRVYGPDLLLAVCEHSLLKGYKHFFYGGAEGVADQLVVKLKQQFPTLNVSGIYSPPFRDLSDKEDLEVVEMINKVKPNIIWVGLGAPKQEKWMAEHLQPLAPSILIGVGAAFDFHAGIIAQAPKWMQRSGLEWLFRLLTEPRRLWKRYLVNNFRFILYMALQISGLRRYETISD